MIMRSHIQNIKWLGWVLAALLMATGCSDVKFDSAREPGKKTCTGKGCTNVTGHTYTWNTGAFGMCSKPCGGGEQTRPVTCRRDDGVDVADSFCSGTKPTGVQSCNLLTCNNPTYNWNIGAYGMCSKTCGGGTQSRTVVCQTNAGVTVADALCPQPKPGTDQTCNTQACDPNYTYAWEYGQYGACSTICGGGTQTRPVYCKRSDGTVVDDAFCVALPKPGTTQACNTQSCDSNFTYDWLKGEWSMCSKTCGGGLRTRSVVCKRNDGQFVTEALCPQPKPGIEEACNTQTCPINTRPVRTSSTVSAAQTKVDILLIFDDSGSMAQDNTKLATRMNGFLGSLTGSNLDYQICVTATNVNYYNGRPIMWVGAGTHIMRPATPNKQKVFEDTILAIGSGYSSDEQAIKATNLAVDDNARTGCFRADAALSVILISDEDERSVGGIKELSTEQYKPLGAQNMPDNLIANVAAKFDKPGFKKPFTVNSIIVKPGDSTCEAMQDAQGDPSFPGRLYAELSNKTGGYIGSICDTDYTTNLKYVKEHIQNSLPALTLECIPVGTPVVTISPNFTTTKTMVGNQMRFDPAIPQGSTVTVDYNCLIP